MREPLFLTEQHVIIMHDRSLDHFGGARGIRDLGMLQSAIGRAQNIIAYESSDPVTKDDLVSAACAIAHGVVQNHPFLDGNKRTDLLCLRGFLTLNGCSFEPKPGESADMFIALAAGEATEAEFRKWTNERTEYLRDLKALADYDQDQSLGMKNVG